jgi:hypothetical protein
MVGEYPTTIDYGHSFRGFDNFKSIVEQRDRPQGLRENSLSKKELQPFRWSRVSSASELVVVIPIKNGD